jgi:large subunit ribosomal protein L21
MEAVIATGGKQYRVSPGQVIAVERLPAVTKGSTVEFTSVLLVTKDGKLVAAPAELRRAKVSAEVVGERKGRKVTIVKYKRRKNYRRNRGHRQIATTVRITKIEV